MSAQLAMFDLGNPEPDPEPLWGAAVARNTDPATSHQAAEHAALKAGTHRALALRALARAADGLTDFELAQRTGIQQTSIGKRRGELVRMGLAESAGTTRPAPSGSPAMVWRVTARGRQEAA